MVAAYSREDYGRMSDAELTRRLGHAERAALSALTVETLLVEAFYAQEIRAVLEARK